MSELFNSISGYSVGIPPIEVVDSNGNIKTNVFTNGNVTASNIYAAQYFYANGDSISGLIVAGNSTHVQFNGNNQLDSSPNFTFNKTSNLLSVTNISVSNTTFLGNIGNVKITGGQPNYLLTTDGLGNLSWVEVNTDPGGDNTQIQFNDNGMLSGSSGLTFNTITNTFTTGTVIASDIIGNLVGTATTALVAQTVSNNIQPNITSIGTLTSLSVSGNANTGNINAVNGAFTNVSGNGAGITAITGANVIGVVSNATHSILSNTVIVGAQPNITSVGTLTSISVSGNSILSNVNILGAANTNSVTIGSYLRANNNSIVEFFGNINFAYSPNLYLGDVSRINISGGNSGFVLTTNGMGTISWNPPPGGPGGANTQVQFNNSGVLSGSSNLTFNNQTNTLTIAGSLIANSFQMGVGPYGFFNSEVHLTSTSSTSPNQVLYGAPAQEVASIDFVIISTDNTDGTRTSTKISATVLGTQVAYTEYAGIQINGGVGSFAVGYNAGNVQNPAQVVLLCSPDSSNYTTHNILVTKYASI